MNMLDPVEVLLKQKSSEVRSVSPEASIYDAIELMASKQIGALLVLSGERLAGIVTERDYARKVILRGKSSRTTQVREIMTSAVITVSTADTVQHCMRLMTDRRVRYLPVVERDKVVGIISAQQATIEQLQNYVTGAYPA